MKKKIKKFGGGALSSVDPSQTESVMSRELSEEDMLGMNTIPKGITPYIQGNLEEDSFGSRKQITPGVQFGTDKLGGLGVDLYADLEKRESKENMFGPAEDTIKSVGVGVQNKFGRLDYRQNKSGGKSGSFRVSKTFQYKEGGINKYPTFNQDNTVVRTGGFADSNYQDYVKTLIEK
jgi:hypothetical protein